MKIGIVTCGGASVGTVTMEVGREPDPFQSDLDGYEPQGRADDPGAAGPASPAGQASPGRGHHLHHHRGAGGSDGVGEHHGQGYAPRGENFQPHRGQPFRQGSAETDQAIVEAANAHHLDPNTMRSIASIESSMNPSSNANRATQYKGLYQVGHNEWDRFGAGGNIYSARDNAMGAARMFDANRRLFHQRYGRDPTDTELYMMHQQGLGFYTRGAMTNIGGNPYPGMHGAQTHETFEAGWGREVARRKAEFERLHPNVAEAPVFNPETMVP